MNPKKYRELLNDPSFWVVGIVAGILLPLFSFLVGGIVVPMLLYRWDNPTKSFTIEEKFREIDAFDFLEYFDKEFSQKIEIRIENEACRGLRIATFRLSNNGETPILPSDFAEPLTISAKKPWKIIAITTGVEWFGEKDKLDWNTTSEYEWEMRPTLFNPGDSITAVVYAIPSGGEIAEVRSDQKDIFDIHARIIGVASLEATKGLSDGPPLALSTIVSLEGWSVYAFVVLWVALVSTFMLLSYTSGVLPRVSLRTGTIVVFLGVTTMATSEILVSLYTGPQRTGHQQWAGSWIILLFQLGLGIVFSYRTYTIWLQRRNRAALESPAENSDSIPLQKCLAIPNSDSESS